jgi:hypothetical protein
MQYSSSMNKLLCNIFVVELCGITISLCKGETRHLAVLNFEADPIESEDQYCLTLVRERHCNFRVNYDHLIILMFQIKPCV